MNIASFYAYNARKMVSYVYQNFTVPKCNNVLFDK